MLSINKTIINCNKNWFIKMTYYDLNDLYNIFLLNKQNFGCRV